MAYQYRVLSPDRFDIAPTYYSSVKKAKTALAKWVKGYSHQGYYSQTCYNGYVRRITPNELPDYCEIVRV